MSEAVTLERACASIQPGHMTFQEDLDKLRCVNPGCNCDQNVLIFSAACHPEGGVEVVYVRDKGCLALYCRECGKPIKAIAVAAKVRN